ncbi:3-oxoacyl-ACP synthase [Candidatus Aerophobetes bacterium]|uniref:Beta-ketoacyl-[acyl-carrier-protein] synthase III n=1 Tax=Aerophobetes bacterium TaxID=2030807 RepID=A0A497E4G6_UNCAE|nr:ketoacyl-ACP synthase III [Candidatus Aerophobetes bacterium]RLE09658.1 MAG: 3-oxoacyl-ACP synthase [Candidatus Aerophobetes bacterium]
MKLRETQIAGTGSYIPSKVLTNFDLEKMVDTSDEWISTRTGIKERRIAREDEAASDLAYEASKKALESANVRAEDLDMILVATITPDMIFPATACILQDRLGAKKAAAFDLEAACSGFLYGLSIGSQFIATGMYDTILVIAAEALSKIVDWQDRSTCVIFADGAGAAVLRPSNGESKIISTYLGADGGGADLVGVPAGGSRLPASLETVKNRQHYMKMKGNELFKRAVKIMVQAIEISLERGKLSPEDIDFFIPHQANIRIINAVVKRIGLSMDKVYINLDRCGNMSAASIAVALDQAIKENRIKRGDRVLFTSFGGGLTWASMVVRF